MNDENPAFLSEQQDAIEVFEMSMSDFDITTVLRNRIAKSETWYDSSPQYKLKDTRMRNGQLMFGDHYKAGSYPTVYRSSLKYTEPQIYAAIQTVVSYLTSRIHEVEARPFNDSIASRQVAKDFAKFAEAHGVEHDLINKLVRILYDAFQKRVGVLKFVHDAGYKSKGDICPRHINPENVIFDHTAGIDDNPSFIAEKVPAKVSDILDRFPDKKDAIYEHFGMKKGTAKQLDADASYYEVWITGRGKDGKPEEQLVCFVGGLVLLKTRNPHYNYDVEEEEIGNGLPYPPKPYLSLNILNDGTNKLDQTSLIELVAPLQEALNRRKRTIGEQAERYAGLKVFSGDAVDKSDVEELSGEPDESIVVDSENVNNAVTKISPDFLPEFIWRDALDIRETIHEIIGTPPNMRGAQSDTETLGEAIMQRDQAQGRMEPLVRALDAFMDKYYLYLYHFAKIYYTEEHWQSVAGEDGTFDYVMMQRDRLKDGLDVMAIHGTNIPLDEERMTNIAVKLKSMNALSTLDMYRMMKLPKADQLFENHVKEQVDPTMLVKDANIEDGDRTAYMDYEVIKAGKFAPPREDPKPGHIDLHRQQMLRDEWNNPEVWTPEKKAAFEAHLQAEIDSVSRKASGESLAIASKEAEKADTPEFMKPSGQQQPPAPEPPQDPAANFAPGGGQAPTGVAPVPAPPSPPDVTPPVPTNG